VWGGGMEGGGGGRWGGHAHRDVPEGWPALDEVIAYRDRVRSAILESIGELAAHAATSLMAERSRVLSMAIEHELMHQETLLYIVQQLHPDQKLRPTGVVYPTENGVRPRSVAIPEGKATLGASFDALHFGWDNEFPLTRVEVPAFVIDSTPVTNEQFRYF